LETAGWAGPVSQGMYGLLSVEGEAFEDCPAGGVGDGFENIVSDGWHG
jgi:hypothetical protein